MSDSYSKLLSSITASTVWMEPDAVRIVWITLLAMKRKDGCVYASIPGLANIARVSVADCRLALAKFLAPDEDSRTKDFEGRRIEEIDGGWRVLNAKKFDQIRSAEERREYMREYMRKRRKASGETDEESEGSEPVNNDVSNVNREHHSSSSSSSSTKNQKNCVDARASEGISPAAQVTTALIKLGTRCTPSNPKLLETLKTVPPEEIIDTATEYPGKPLGYILTAVTNRRAETKTKPETRHARPRQLTPSERVAQAIAAQGPDESHLAEDD